MVDNGKQAGINRTFRTASGLSGRGMSGREKGQGPQTLPVKWNITNDFNLPLLFPSRRSPPNGRKADKGCNDSDQPLRE
mgnify:CR=1 FL=1|jgi:hypothetical protein